MDKGQKRLAKKLQFSRQLVGGSLQVFQTQSSSSLSGKGSSSVGAMTFSFSTSSKCGKGKKY